MKTILLLIGLLAIGFISFSFMTKEDQIPQIEYKVVTSVESIVPNGLGRSRLISSNEDRNFEDYTYERSDEDDKKNQIIKFL
jgi:hypothetical protein